MKPEQDMILENLSDAQREIVEVIGFEGYMKLVRLVNGDSIYIPKYSELLKPCIDAEIRENFDGYNYKELAEKYNLTVKTIYNKVPKKLRIRKRNSQIDGQLSF